MSAEKIFQKHGFQREILSMAKKSCYELTDRYRKCRPPYRYKNSATGETRECFKECYEHAAEWLKHLLQNMPTKMQVAWGGKIADVNIPFPRDPYFMIRSSPLNHKQRLIEVEFLDGTTDPRDLAVKNLEQYPLKNTDVYLPESISATAKQVEDLLNGSRHGAELWVYIPPTNDVGRIPGAFNVSFPGNEAWSRFAAFIDRDFNLVLRLHR